MSYPNTFIVGAAKAGTTSLHHYLGQHPQVFMSAWKEPHHFADIAISPRHSHQMRRYADEAAYRALFADAGERPVVGEASPSYLWEPGAAARIRARVPDARIIVLLREPVDRAFSHYWMDLRQGLQTKPPLEAFREDYALPGKSWGARGHLYVELGLYAQQLTRYFDAFPREQVRIYLFDELQSRPDAVLADLAGFLGIDPAPMSAVDTDEHRNPYARPRGAIAGGLMRQVWLRQAAQRVVPPRLRRGLRDRLLLRRDAKPQADAAAVSWLREIYAPEIDALERMLDRPLPTLRAFTSA